ncbi:MAG: M48 family metalloprotease [bacterium]
MSPFILSLVLLLGGCASTPNSQYFKEGGIPQGSIPASSSISQTRAAIIQELGRKQGFYLTDSGADHARVDRIVRRLSRTSGLGNFSYPVVIADAGNKVNAMAVNGNTIVVYKELLRRVPDDNELAAVLAHEVSHITNRHHHDATMQQRLAMVQIGAGVLGGLIGSSMDNADAGKVAADIANTLGTGAYVNSYSRSMEFEADHTGMLLMAKAGYNPNAALSFWGKAGQIFGTKGSSDFLSTHPSGDRRLERLRRDLPLAMRYYQTR